MSRLQCTLALLFLPCLSFGQSLPDAPSRARVLDKKFAAAATVGLLSGLADAEMTHQGLASGVCVEANPFLAGHPSRAELYGYIGIEQIAIDAGALLLKRFIRFKDGREVPWFWALPIGYGTQAHIRGALSWQRCMR